MRFVTRLTMFALMPMLAACHSSDGGQASSTMALRIYDVPPAQTDVLSSALARVLNKNASVTMAGPGKLLIYAPADTQASIKDAIADLRDSSPGKAQATPVELHAWIINAEPGDAPDDPALKALGPSLAALRQTMGPSSFHLEQAISAAGSENHSSSLTLKNQGSMEQFDFQVGAIQGDVVSMDVSYNMPTGVSMTMLGQAMMGVQAHLDTRLGQYTLLAKAPGSCPTSATPSAPCEKSWRLLVVRADRIDSSH